MTRKAILTLSLACCLAAIASAASETREPIDDVELARRLVGTWVNGPADKSPMLGSATYNFDGTGRVSMHSRDEPESTSIRLTTRWSIKGRILSLKCLKSSDPQRIPVGLELKDRIISISEDRFVFEPYKGYGDRKVKQEVRVRKK
jgi:hypothetical protein